MKAKSGKGGKGSPADEPASVQDPPSTGPRSRILVVDVNWEIHRVNAQVPIEFGCQMDTAKDGAAA